MALSPELLAEIKQAIADGSLNAAELQQGGRSPFRPRQLHDLRLLPTKDDPRPTFFPSAEGPRNDGGASMKTFPYPRLLWSQAGEEITVQSATEHHDYVAKGYLEKDPGTIVIDQAAQMRAMLEALSPADRSLIIQGQKKARMQSIQDQLAELSDADVDAVLNSFSDQGKQKSA
jgi:hypothetical protein